MYRINLELYTYNITNNIMRKITAKCIEKFYDRGDISIGNTIVSTESEGDTTLYLFENDIAVLNNDETSLKITTAGWNTVTTRERLNGLKNVSLRNSKGILYLNDKEWDGNWIEVL